MYKDHAPTYQATNDALKVDRQFYDRVRDSTEHRTLEKKIEVPKISSAAWRVTAGQVFRIVTPYGPQVGDFNMWNANDPRERMWTARTRQLQGCHLSTYDRVWSTLPFMRPMVTIVDDSLADYGVDEYGARVHDILGTRCDPYINKILTGKENDHHCHSNLVRAILPYGLTEFDVHDVINLFQVTGMNKDELYFARPCPAKAGDYIEFFAEIDLLCAISTCPAGDLSVDLWGPDSKHSDDICRPLGVEIYSVTSLLDNWKSPNRASYSGMHGLKYTSS